MELRDSLKSLYRVGSIWAPSAPTIHHSLSLLSPAVRLDLPEHIAKDAVAVQ